MFFNPIVFMIGFTGVSMFVMAGFEIDPYHIGKERLVEIGLISSAIVIILSIIRNLIRKRLRKKRRG